MLLFDPLFYCSLFSSPFFAYLSVPISISYHAPVQMNCSVARIRPCMYGFALSLDMKIDSKSKIVENGVIIYIYHGNVISSFTALMLTLFLLRGTPKSVEHWAKQVQPRNDASHQEPPTQEWQNLDHGHDIDQAHLRELWI